MKNPNSEDEKISKDIRNLFRLKKQNDTAIKKKQKTKLREIKI